LPLKEFTGSRGT